MRRLGLGVMAVWLAACGGAATPTATTVAPTAAATTAAVQAATTAPAAQGTASSPNIADALKAGKQSAYKVTYKWTVTAAGQTQISEQTWYHKPPKTRFDFSAGPGALFSVYTLEDGTYTCTGAAGQMFCQKGPAGSGLDTNPAAAFGLQLQDHPEQFNSSFQGSRSIAGQTVQCYGVKSLVGAAFGDVTTCYSPNGVPLLTQMKLPGSDLTMEASDFSTAVSDADFVVPK